MNARILIVDDEEEFVAALAERLRIRDYDVATSFNGEDALAKVTQYNYDVVFLDVRMPGMDGVDVLRAIRRIKPLTEVIMLTGHATVEAAIEGMRSGAFDFLLKPVDTGALIEKIEKAYERKSAHEERIREAKVRDFISSPRSALK